jgi:hypothetical protein
MKTVFCKIVRSATKLFNRIIDKEAERVMAFYNNVFELPQDREGKKGE